MLYAAATRSNSSTLILILLDIESQLIIMYLLYLCTSNFKAHANYNRLSHYYIIITS